MMGSPQDSHRRVIILVQGKVRQKVEALPRVNVHLGQLRIGHRTLQDAHSRVRVGQVGQEPHVGVKPVKQALHGRIVVSLGGGRVPHLATIVGLHGRAIVLVGRGLVQNRSPLVQRTLVIS